MPSTMGARSLGWIVLLCGAIPLSAQEAAPMPDPQVMVRRQRLDVGEMLGEGAPKPTVTTQEGLSATTIRNAGKGMTADVSAELALPRALTWAELLKADPALTKLVPWLATVPEPKVSPLFYALYRAKWEETNKRMLDGMPAEKPAEFYDLAGAWEIPAAEGRPAMLVLRGQYGLRASTEPGDALTGPISNATSVPFNPRTAYRWKDGTPNGVDDKVKAALRIQTELKREYAISGLPRARNRELENAMAQRKAELDDLPKWNYLASKEIPYFSLPLLFRQYPEYGYAPRLGDSAVVIAGGLIGPALYGDESAEYLSGEISEALATTLEVKAPRPLTVLIFTGSAPGEPEAVTPEKLRERVVKYVPLPEPPAPPVVTAPALAPTVVPAPAAPVEAVAPVSP